MKEIFLWSFFDLKKDLIINKRLFLVKRFEIRVINNNNEVYCKHQFTSTNTVTKITHDIINLFTNLNVKCTNKLSAHKPISWRKAISGKSGIRDIFLNN